MKTTVLTTLIVIVLIATSAAQVSQSSVVASVPALHLTHQQVAQLINTASTPEDHRALAQYFRQEAQRKREKDQYYMEMASIYRMHPPRVDMYRNVSMSDYYRHLADEAWNKALADDQLAKFQDRLAKGLATSK